MIININIKISPLFCQGWKFSTYINLEESYVKSWGDTIRKEIKQELRLKINRGPLVFVPFANKFTEYFDMFLFLQDQV